MEKLFFFLGQLPFFFFTAIVSIKYHLRSYFCRIIQMPKCVKINLYRRVSPCFCPKILIHIHPQFICGFNTSFFLINNQLIDAIDWFFRYIYFSHNRFLLIYDRRDSFLYFRKVFSTPSSGTTS